MAPALLFALLVLADPGPVAPASPFHDLAEAALPGLVRVVGYDRGDTRLRARPGFFVGETHVVTVRHPLIGAQRAEVHAAGGATFEVVGIDDEDLALDVVLLRVATPTDGVRLGVAGQARRALRWAEREPAAGDLVIVVTAVEGGPPAVSAGRLVEHRDLPGVGPVLALDAPLPSLREGSPVLDYDGRVVGLASVGYDSRRRALLAFVTRRLTRLVAGDPVGLPRWSDEAQAAIRRPAADLYALGRAAVAADNLEIALARLEQAIVKAPGHHDAWVSLGVVQARLERWDEAIECFERVVRLFRDHVEAQTNLCLALAHLERWTAARVRCDEARRLAPRDPRVLLQQARALEALGSPEGALAGYDALLEQDPRHVEALYARGVLLAGRGRYPEAIAALEALGRVDAGHRDTLRRLGDAYQGADRHHEATEAYRKALELHGPDAQVLARLGQSWLALNQAGRAQEALEQAVRLQPAEAKTFFALGRSFVHLRRPEQAATMFRQAVRLSEGYSAAWFELGEVLRGQGQHAEAVEAYQRCLALDGRHGGALYGLGLAHLRRGDRDAAWEQVRRLQPQDATRARELADQIIE